MAEEAQNEAITITPPELVGTIFDKEAVDEAKTHQIFAFILENMWRKSNPTTSESNVVQPVNYASVVWTDDEQREAFNKDVEILTKLNMVQFLPPVTFDSLLRSRAKAGLPPFDQAQKHTGVWNQQYFLAILLKPSRSMDDVHRKLASVKGEGAREAVHQEFSQVNSEAALKLTLLMQLLVQLVLAKRDDVDTEGADMDGAAKMEGNETVDAETEDAETEDAETEDAETEDAETEDAEIESVAAGDAYAEDAGVEISGADFVDEVVEESEHSEHSNTALMRPGE